MVRTLTVFLLAVAINGCSSQPTDKPLNASNIKPKQTAESGTQALPAFIPASFTPPPLVVAPSFKLVPLGPELALIDYQAYMSSIEHLQTTFTRSKRWPHANLNHQDALIDMQNEQRRFNARESFAYAVLTLDGLRERGCVYIRPSAKSGHDAQVSLWVTKDEYDNGFDEALYAWTRQWVAASWPFQRVAYPGREISWNDWDAMQ